MSLSPGTSDAACAVHHDAAIVVDGDRIAIYWVMTIATAMRATAELSAPFTSAPALRAVIPIGGLGQLAGVTSSRTRAVVTTARRRAPAPPTRSCRWRRTNTAGAAVHQTPQSC